MPNGPFITGGLDTEAAAANTAWSETMGPNTGDRITGVFWAAFLLFSWTAASIVSGSVIERIKSGAFWVLAVVIGSVAWIIDAAWGWHYGGWMVQLLGYHDAYASGVIHAIAGGFALGVLVVLGPRLGKFARDGSPRNITPHNPWLVCLGLFMIYAGFWGLLCGLQRPDHRPGRNRRSDHGRHLDGDNDLPDPDDTRRDHGEFPDVAVGAGCWSATSPPRGTRSGPTRAASPASSRRQRGNDLYHPIQAMVIAGVGTYCAYKLHYWVEEKFKIDDAVGAVAVHGYAGFIGLVICGFVLWGHPSSPYEGFAAINPLGQFVGAIIMFFVLGLPAGLDRGQDPGGSEPAPDSAAGRTAGA